MWIIVMNLLLAVSVVLFLVLTGLSVRAYAKSKRFWREVELKADQSPLKAFND